MVAFPGRSSLHTFAVLPPPRRLDPVGGIRAAAAAGTAAAAAAGGLTLLVRRLAGGFAEVPPPGIGWLIVAAGIGAILAVDAAGGQGWPRLVARAGLVAATLAFAPIMESLDWSGRVAGLGPLVLAAVAALLPASNEIGRCRSGRDARPRRPGEHPLASAPASPQRPGPAPADADSNPDPALVPVGFRQRTERYETAAGVDCLRGRAILAVATGSRTGFAHVGFCPSFAATPQVEVSSDYDGVEAELIVAETLPWGVRLECRLAEPAEEPVEIPIDFEARLSPPTP